MKVTFITLDNEHIEVSGQSPSTLMELAMDAGVPGIDADCGGGCSCATCHVYVDENWRQIVGGPNELEEGMLDFQSERQASSRLSCQMPVDERFDGLVLRVAPHD